MIAIEKVDTKDKAQVDRFIRFPFRLYQGNPNWVPPILMDLKDALNRDKHPFHEHADIDFFLATSGSEVVGRIAAIVNHRFNKHQGKEQAQFFFFDCVEDREVAVALFNHLFEWAKERDMKQVVGPKGMGPLDGYGMLVEGFDKRQSMNMALYNAPYYPVFVESLGFQKEVDFVSTYIDPKRFRMPERVHRIAERVLNRGSLQIRQFPTKRELRKWAPRIGQTYNQAFVNNWEYYPLTQNELDFVVDNILLVANPKLIKVITHNEDVVGFCFGFPDVSAAMQRARGNLLPFGIIDLLIELRRTNWVALNGVGILPEFHGRGGNALIYSEVYNTVADFRYEHAVLVQVAETATEMRSDLINLGAEPYNNHRVYIRDL